MDSTPVPAARGRRVAVGIGLSVFVLAYGWLIVAGTGGIRASADPGAATISLWAAALPPLAALALTRMIGPSSAPPDPLRGVPHRRIAWESLALVVVVIAFPLASLATGRGLWYPVVKVILLLAVPLVVFRLLRGRGPRARAIPTPVVWLAPLPAVAAWFLLTEVWPFTRPLTQDLPDPVTLAIGSLVTLLTAGVLEEICYRGWLQTRLERMYGRWPAVFAVALLFSFMHLGRVRPDEVGIGLAGIVAYQGMFGLMQGYLWSRYRNIWVVIAIHIVLNLVYVDLLLGR